MKTESQIADDFRTAVHEWGHYEAFAHYGINSIPKVLDEAEWYPLQDGQLAVGHCSPEQIRSDTSKFQKSVIGWCGYMAELVVGVQHPERDIGLPLKAEFLPDCYRAAMCRLETLSRTDQIMICGYKSPWVTFKRAFHLLRRKKAKLTRYACMTTGAAEPETVAMPEKFPAPLAEFLQRIVGGSDAAEKFRAFVFDQAAKSFAAPQFALDAAQQKDAAEKWTAARLEKFRAGFTSADEWRSAARAFKSWSNSARNDS